MASSSTAAQEDDDTNAMDYMPSETVSTEPVSTSTEDDVPEYEVPTRLENATLLILLHRTPEERATNDEVMREMADDIVSTTATSMYYTLRHG